ncbi:Ig-like domain-containing protein [Pontiellaceae bacterium B12227]|nr:Ig-like domain-containing protein [Pontiellaceae bacterium B12227]
MKRCVAVLMVVGAVAVCASAQTDYYVETTGSDTNSGSLLEPFATIQHAVGVLAPGDTCYIRGGTYREVIDLSGVAGSSNSPITLAAYQDETVTMDGTVAITNNWALDAGNVYKTTVAEDVTQLFVDGRMMTLARYPNAPVFSDACWSKGSARIEWDAGLSSNGYLVDEELAGLDYSLNGCIAILNCGNHHTAARVVENHVAGSNTFTYAAVQRYKTTDEYFFEGGSNNAERVLLDSAEEWGYDESSGTLYLWADDGLNPNGRQIFGKGTNVYSLVGNADTHDVVIDGIDFFATTFYFNSSDNVTIQNCDLDYYVCSQRSLGSIQVPRTAYFEGTETDFCEDITVFNCAFRYADGGGMWGNYVEDMRVENNLFYNIDHAVVNLSDNEIGSTVEGHAQSTMSFKETRDFIYRRNTIDTAGSAQGIILHLYDSTEGRPWTVEYNFHTGCGKMEGSDTSSVYCPHEHVTESVGRYNWFIGNRRDFRWDGNNTPVVLGVRANLYRNIAMATFIKGIAGPGDAYYLKGDYHEVYNNVGIGGAQAELAVPVALGGNAHTTTRNNAADSLTDNPIPGTNSCNYVGQERPSSMTQLLRDTDNWDFRPSPDAIELVDQGTNVLCSVNGEYIDVTAGYLGAAPDLGAYELGASEYWIPGRQLPQASVPIPADGNTNALYDCDLMWLGGLGSGSYNIYLGMASNSLAFMGSQTNNIFNPGGWLNDQIYYWRIDSVLTDNSVVTGEVWSFTINDHRPRANSGRYSVMEDHSLEIELTGSDIDGDPLTYAVVNSPAHGSLSGTAPDFTYTPDADYSGEDVFAFVVNDGTSDSRKATVMITVFGTNDAPRLSTGALTVGHAVKDRAYHGTVAGWAWDVDDDPISYNKVNGSAWLEIAADGMLSGTPGAADIGVNSWAVEVSDSNGVSTTGTLELVVFEEDLLTSLDFTDLNSVLVSNTLQVGMSTNNLSVSGVASGNNYRYSMTYTGADYDGDSTNDTLTFEVLVEGWSDGVVTTTLDGGANVTSNGGTAVIGAADADVVLGAEGWAVDNTHMNAGETLEFSVQNIEVSLSAAEIGTGLATGFTGTVLDEIANSYGHQTVIGSGTNLLEGRWDAPSFTMSDFCTSTEPLLISSAPENTAGHDVHKWQVQDVDFSIDVSVAVIPPSVPPTLSFTDLNSVISGNTLKAGGSTNNLSISGVATNNDYLYSVTYTGADYDGDSTNDTLSFDVLVEAWSGSDAATTFINSDTDKNAHCGTATIGTTDAAVTINGNGWAVDNANMSAGETLEISLRNIAVSTSLGGLYAASLSGFTGTSYKETGNGYGHQVVVGVGERGLFASRFNASTFNLSGLLSEGNPLVITSADIGGVASANPQRWNLKDIDFGINVLAVPPGSYSAWAFSYGLEGDEALANADTVDQDGYDNLAEYALGMNPTNADAGSGESIGRAVAGGTNWFEYVHNRRTDYAEQGLSYLLIDSTNLLNSITSTNTQDQIIVGPVFSDYESVTNRYEITDAIKFIKLDVLQD